MIGSAGRGDSLAFGAAALALGAGAALGAALIFAEISFCNNKIVSNWAESAASAVSLLGPAVPIVCSGMGRFVNSEMDSAWVERPKSMRSIKLPICCENSP